MKSRSIILIMAILLLSVTASAKFSFESLKFYGGSPQYDFESLNFNVGCGQAFCSFGRDINNRGDVVGWGGGGVFGVPEVGFMLDKHGNRTTIAYPGAIATRASGINDPGDIVGQYNEIPGFNNLRAFLLDKHGNFQNADYPGSTQSALWGINNRGQAVGEYQVSGEPGHAYVRNRDGSVESFDLPPELLEPGRTLNYTRFKDINNHGDIVGQYSVSGGPYIVEVRGFLLDKKGRITLIDYPVVPQGNENFSVTVPLGINNKGVIAGGYIFQLFTGTVFEHGFVRSPKGVLTTVDFPTATSTEIYKSSDSGVIVGGWRDMNGESNAFVGHKAKP